MMEEKVILLQHFRMRRMELTPRTPSQQCGGRDEKIISKTKGSHWDKEQNGLTTGPRQTVPASKK